MLRSFLSLPCLRVRAHPPCLSKSNTGVNVNQAVITEFNEFKLRSKYRYMVFKLNDKNEEVVIDKTGAPGAPYSEFVASLPDNDCRYAVYNAEYSTDDGERAKFVFFLWYPCPPFLPPSSPMPAGFS